MIGVSRTQVRSIRILASTIVLSIVGVGLKVDRYANPRAPLADAEVRAGLAAVARDYGWDATTLPPDGRETFGWLAFAHPACEPPLIVAMLPPRGEIDGLVRVIYGDNVALIDPNTPLQTQRWHERLMSASVEFLRRTGLANPSSSGPAGEPRPRLAIHPAPGSGPAACPAPGVRVWHGFSPGGSKGSSASANGVTRLSAAGEAMPPNETRKLP
jgi:hypothetical protein